jgi:hypothetical protein
VPRAALPALAAVVTCRRARPGEAPHRPPPPPQAAVVALGDSAASGEGAGDYAPGTRGEGGDWCHRSPHAYIHATRLAPVAIDLACSGADTADITGTRQYGEPAQSAQLAAAARRYRVTTVVLQIGANDDAALVATGVTCIRAFLDVLTPPCRETVGPLVPQRMAATAAKVEQAVGAVRAVMRDAGYRRRGVAARARLLRGRGDRAHDPAERGAGLPVQPRGRAVGPHGAVPRAVGRAARGWPRRTGAAFLDLLRATEGRKRAAHEDAAQDWQRRVTVDPRALVYGGLDAVGYHLAQESFHPTAAAHAAIGGCLAAFVRSGEATGACVPGPGAGLTLRSSRV